MMRQKWTWDRVVHGSRGINCTGHCAFNIYVKDGIVWREEQVADYEQTNPEVPDFNPRGCQKGGCYSDRMYDSSRLTTPLKRTGERGEGKWQRISWDEALDLIAKALQKIKQEYGPEAVTAYFGRGSFDPTTMDIFGPRGVYVQGRGR